MCFWSWPPDTEITPELLPNVAHALRNHGGRRIHPLGANMPLDDLQRAVFAALRARRNPDSHVGGAVALHRDDASPRYSEDMLREARRMVETLPVAEVGCLYLGPAGQPVTPDPASGTFGGLGRHFWSLRGSWPRVVEE